MFGNLDRRHRHTCARSDHQHSLISAQLRARGQHAPGGEERERKGRRFLPAEPDGLAKHAARVDVNQLASGAVRVLAEHAEMGAPHVLAGAAPLAFPIAQGGEQDDLVSGFHAGSPDAWTTPAPSPPITRGGAIRCAPCASQRSRWLMEAARMATATEPGRGSVRALSRILTPAGPIGSSYTAARPWLSTATPDCSWAMICET